MSPPPSPSLLCLCHLRLTWALPLAERWDSFTEASGCQERASPRKRWANVFGSLGVRRGPFLYPLPSFLPPPLLLYLFLCSCLALWLAASTHTSEKITLICVKSLIVIPVDEPQRRGPVRYGSVAYPLIYFSLCGHRFMCVCVRERCVFGLHSRPMDKQNALQREGTDSTKKDLEQMFGWPLSLTSFHHLVTSSFPSSFSKTGC